MNYTNTKDVEAMEAEDRAQMRKLVPQITQALGAGWTWEPGVSSQNMAICRADGARVCVQHEWGAAGRGKITVRASLTTQLSKAHRGVLPKMTASLTRSPESIAKDITRKLLPALDEAVKSATESAEKDATAYAARKAMVAKLHDEFGLSVYRFGGRDDDRAQLHRYGGGDGGVSADVEVNHRADSLTLKLQGPTWAILAALQAVYGKPDDQ